MHIALADCKARHIYRLRSRNLSIGVFDPEQRGFIGLRVKFDAEYLFTEYHFDTGPPFGTAHPLEDLGELPPNIILAETLGTVDSNTRRPVFFDRPVADGGKGWCFEDTGEASMAISPVSVSNSSLLDLLKQYPSH